jgi:hypothetical protein
MSHTDFIAPFPMEDAYGKPAGWIPELRINGEEFTERLLKRWPHTSKPEIIYDAEGVTSYFYELRIVPHEYSWHLYLRYSCLVSIDRPSDEILASIAYIYRQCVPREHNVYIWGLCEIPLDTNEAEILKITTTPLSDKD